MKLTAEQIKNAIQEHENKIEELQEELKKSSYVTGFERAIERQEYSYITGESEVFQAPEIGSKTDGLSFNCANYGSEKRMSLLEKMNRLQRLMYRFSAENGGDEIDLDNLEQEKYFLRHNFNKKAFEIDYCFRCQNIGEIFFISEDVVEQALEQFRPLMEEIIIEEQEVREYYLELNSKEKLTSPHKFPLEREFIIGEDVWEVIDISEDETGVIYDIREMYEEGSGVLSVTESELTEIILRGSFNE